MLRPRWLKLGLTLLVPLLLYTSLAAPVAREPRVIDFPGLVGCVGYSANGQWLYCASPARLELRDAHTLRLVWSHSYTNSSDVLHAFALSHDSQRLVISQGHRIQVWNLAHHTRLLITNMPSSLQTEDLCFAPSDSAITILARPSTPRTSQQRPNDLQHDVILQLNLKTRRYQPEQRNIMPGIRAFSPTGKTLALVEGNSSPKPLLRIRDGSTGRILRAVNLAAGIPAHNASDMAFNADDRTIATILNDSVVWLWHTHDTQQDTLLVQAQRDELSCLAFAPDGETIAVGDVAGRIQLWDVKSGHLQRTLNGQHGIIEGLFFAPDGSTLAAACEKNMVQLWHIK